MAGPVSGVLLDDGIQRCMTMAFLELPWSVLEPDASALKHARFRTTETSVETRCFSRS